MLQYKTKLEKSKKVQKSQNAGSPLGGWGAGSKEPTQSNFLLLLRVTNINKLIEKCRLVLIPNEPKGLQNMTMMTTEDGETLGGF